MKVKQKIPALFLSTVLLMSTALTGCSTKASSARFSGGGSGTAEDPYQISTADQLDEVRNNLTASYVLTDDIDISGYENWVPIGTVMLDELDETTGEMDETKYFSGDFDGSGHTITGLKCVTDKNMIAVGLFGCSSGNVENLTVKNAVVTGDETTMSAGAVIGYAISGNVSEVTLTGDSSITGINCVGGIVGGNMAAINYCDVEGADIVVIGDNDFSGGEIIQCDVAECGGLIAGGSFGGSVDNCNASGTVTANGNEPVALGGIAGCIQCVDSITGNTADVVINAGNGHAIGGLCGFAGIGDDGDGVVNEPCAITDCTVDVAIKADGATHVGGLIGTGLYYYGMEDRFTVENCTVKGTIDGAVTPGTVAGRAVGSTIISCNANVKVDGTSGDTQVGTTDRMYQSGDQYEVGSDGAANGLMLALTGTYDELWKVAFQEKYNDAWLNGCKEYVGEENAQAAVDKLKTSMSGTIIGKDAVDEYTKNPDSTKYCCDFINGVSEITFDGNKISGTDEDGNEVFSHTYTFVGYNEDMGFYEYKSEDENAGEFTYFLLRSDTPASTYHIELRYGSDLDELVKKDSGNYAYWMAAGIIKDSDDATVTNAINLFCRENLSASN